MAKVIKNSQCEMILNHMRKYGSITDNDAVYEYSCQRLAARISDLKDKGYNITGIWETSKNKFGKKVRYKRYILNEK